MAEAGNASRAARHPWPFRAAPTHHDSQISEQGFGVPARQEVEFKDGKRIWLRRVTINGLPELFLRDLGEPLEGTRIDLRKILSDVEKELPTTSTRDVAGYVSISLRLKFATLDEFVAAVGNGAAA
jgi:hypothetical protein